MAAPEANSTASNNSLGSRSRTRVGGMRRRCQWLIYWVPVLFICSILCWSYYAYVAQLCLRECHPQHREEGGGRRGLPTMATWGGAEKGSPRWPSSHSCRIENLALGELGRAAFFSARPCRSSSGSCSQISIVLLLLSPCLAHAQTVLNPTPQLCAV